MARHLLLVGLLVAIAPPGRAAARLRPAFAAARVTFLRMEGQAANGQSFRELRKNALRPGGPPFARYVCPCVCEPADLLMMCAWCITRQQAMCAILRSGAI